jgi:hypothetical protein
VTYVGAINVETLYVAIILVDHMLKLKIFISQQLNVVLDSGLSDLWFADTQSKLCPLSTPEYDSSKY